MNKLLTINTTERMIKFGNERICSWREGFDRDKDKPVAMIDINLSFLENKPWDELTKEDAATFSEAITMLIKDAESHGL